MEDEEHLLLHCTLYSELRSKMMVSFPDINETSYTHIKLVKIMLASNDQQLIALRIFVSKRFDLKKETALKNGLSLQK